MSKKKKRRKETFITLSPTKIEVTSFNGSDSQIHDGEEHA
jgi:CRISPR/Cas system endoribonuclease Cas6 (RAMP superfamily)